MMLNIPDPVSAYNDHMDKEDKADYRQRRAENRASEIMDMRLDDFIILATRAGYDDNLIMIMERVAEMLVDEEK